MSSLGHQRRRWTTKGEENDVRRTHSSNEGSGFGNLAQAVRSDDIFEVA